VAFVKAIKTAFGGTGAGAGFVGSIRAIAKIVVDLEIIVGKEKREGGAGRAR